MKTHISKHKRRTRGWTEVFSATDNIRKPNGYRMVTTTVYCKGDDKLVLTTAPRRPQYASYGQISLNGTIVFTGSKEVAKSMAKKYMKAP